jgi:hypothetical protein
MRLSARARPEKIPYDVRMRWIAPASLGLALFQDRAALSLAWAARLEGPAYLACNVLLPVGAALASVGVFWGLGAFLERRLRADLSPAPRFALGLGAFATAAYLLGLAGAYRGPVLAALWAAAALAAAASWRGARSGGASWRPRGAWQGFCAALIGAAAFQALAAALAPPTAWDVLAYHLALPELHLAAGRVRSVPWLLHSHWPHLMETLYGAWLAFGLDTVPALIHAAACAAWAALAFSEGRRELGPAAAWTAAAVLCAQPVAAEVAGQAHSDGALALFHLAACACLWRGRGAAGGLLAAAGLLSGLGAAAKLQGAALSAALAAWLAWDGRRTGGLRRAAVFLAWAALPALPWHLRVWAETGNPVWPLCGRLFGDSGGSASVAAGLARVCMWRFPKDLPLLPAYGPHFLLAPLLLLSILAAGRGERARLPPYLRFLLAPAAVLAALVWRSHEAWRFLLPAFPAFALTLAWAAERAWRAGGPRRLLAAGALAWALFPILAQDSSNALLPVLGVRSAARPELDAREAYLEKRLEHLPAARAAAAGLGPGDRLLLFREVRGYGLGARYAWGDPVLQAEIGYESLADAAALRARLRSLGITYVLINRAGLYGPDPDYYSPRILALMDGALAGARPLAESGGVAVYPLR